MHGREKQNYVYAFIGIGYIYDKFQHVCLCEPVPQLCFQQHNYASLTTLTLQRRSTDCFIQRPSSYRAVNTFHLGYKNKNRFTL